MSRPRVALAAGTLGLGGTERSMVAHALRLDRTRFDPHVVTWATGGPREADLTAAGIAVGHGNGELDTLTALLRGTDVAHAYRHGIHEPLFVEACRRAGVRVLIETNNFGAVDKSADEAAFACHLFVSQMCMLRYRGWVPPTADFSERHRVSYLPTDTERLRALAPDRRAAKSALGFDPDRPVVGRVGRAADLKWRDLLIDMAPHLVALVPDVQLLYVGMTAAKQRRAGRLGLLERTRAHEAVADDARVALFNRACDVVVSASAIGESLGLGIAEALALGVPVVTCSTPWADNAQVEIVDHGVSGWLASHPRSFAEAVADLLADEGKREAFGAAGAAKIARILDPERQTRQLEDLYAHHLGERDGAPAWWPDAPEFERFAREYPARSAQEFRPLTVRERAEVQVQRRKDRLRSIISTAQIMAISATDRAKRRLRDQGATQ